MLNGGLNLSVLDGWWAEAYDGLNGFAIGKGRTHSNMDVHDTRDGEDLYRVLRDELIPLYYERDPDGLAPRLDQAHETYHSYSGLALQRRPHGDGLHPEMLRPRSRRDLKRHPASLLISLAISVFCGFARSSFGSLSRGMVTSFGVETN